MTAAAGIPFVALAGEPHDIGRRHGEARGAALRAFVDDANCRLERIMPSPPSAAALQTAIAAYDAVIARETPDLAAEIAGLAEGAAIAPAQASLLQLRREIMGYSKIPTRGDCTTYVRPALSGVEPLLAQTVDLNGDLDDHIAVLEIARSRSSRRVLVLSFAGLLGYLGVNSDGLAVGLNLVLGGAWRPGVPPYLAIRHVLDAASSVEEALAILRRLPLASSRSLTLCDADTSACVEVVGDDLRVLAHHDGVHTNHLLHPDLAPRDELNVFARNSSSLRLRACRAALAGLAPDAGVEEHFDLLSQPPICVPDGGDIRRERTVAAVVMLPARGELHVRRGDPSSAATQVFALERCPA